MLLHIIVATGFEQYEPSCGVLDQYAVQYQIQPLVFGIRVAEGAAFTSNKPSNFLETLSESGSQRKEYHLDGLQARNWRQCP